MLVSQGGQKDDFGNIRCTETTRLVIKSLATFVVIFYVVKASFQHEIMVNGNAAEEQVTRMYCLTKWLC